MPLSSFMLEQLRTAAEQRSERVVDLARRICAVPAPTGNEGQRAAFVAQLWRERGYVPEVDALQNVYVRRGQREQRPILMLLAHTDTVFPAGTPLHIVREDNKIRGPGIGDNSMSVASMFCLFDLLDELHVETDSDIVAVANVGEEGLGNLRGARAAVERYRDHVGAVIAIDGTLGSVVHAAVSSKRWRIIVEGPGGHSFGSFGTPSAIHGLGRIIAAISSLEVPADPRTTYNVGVIEGGTSVNTIAARATAQLDMRSTDAAALDKLAARVEALIAQEAGTGLHTRIEVLGERPGGMISLTHPLVQLAATCHTWVGVEPRYTASSTDINIPLSLHIPAVCVGITKVERAHTLEEWCLIPPISSGLAQILRFSIEACAWLAQSA